MTIDLRLKGSVQNEIVKVHIKAEQRRNSRCAKQMFLAETIRFWRKCTQLIDAAVNPAAHQNSIIVRRASQCQNQSSSPCVRIANTEACAPVINRPRPLQYMVGEARMAAHTSRFASGRPVFAPALLSGGREPHRRACN